MKIFISYLIVIFTSWNLLARNVGETEITTDEGIEVFQNEKFYLLKKNVQIISETTHKIIAEGKVLEINDDLSLLIDKFSEPVRNGKLILLD